jgi:hypothetical protein
MCHRKRQHGSRRQAIAMSVTAKTRDLVVLTVYPIVDES